MSSGPEIIGPGGKRHRRRQPSAPCRASRPPRCPEHLTPAAAREWRRVARILDRMGVLTGIDRAALAAYCQAYGRWVEAEAKLRESSLLYRTAGGHVQQSPLLGIINRQLELMGRFMVELGMTPSSRSRVSATTEPLASRLPTVIRLVGPEPARTGEPLQQPALTVRRPAIEAERALPVRR